MDSDFELQTMNLCTLGLFPVNSQVLKMDRSLSELEKNWENGSELIPMTNSSFKMAGQKGFHKKGYFLNTFPLQIISQNSQIRGQTQLDSSSNSTPQN